MAPKEKPRWQKRLKNGYIQRETNSAGHLVYVAQPLYSMDDYDSCTFSRWTYYQYYSWRYGNKAPYALRPMDRRRINIPDNFGYGCTQAAGQSTAETGESQRHPKHRVPVTCSKQGSRSHISLRDDPIEDGCALAGDSNVFLPSEGPWTTEPSPASEATVEDKEVADLVHMGLLKGACGADIQLSDLTRSEPAYTIRYTTRKCPAKQRRMEEVACWEDDLSIIDDSEILEQDWEMV
jgi:hypothetical protein